MQFFVSHSSRDQSLVEQVCKRIEASDVRTYIAEHDFQPGGRLTEKITSNIDESDAVVVFLSEDAANSAIVREEIGYAMGKGILVVPLVTPAVAQQPARLGMLLGLEYIVFDPDDPQEGLLKLTDWANAFARMRQTELHEAERATTLALVQRQTDLQDAQTEALKRAIQQNNAAFVFLAFAAALVFVVAVNSK